MTYAVLEAGDADGEQLQQPTKLGRGHVHGPLLDQALLGVLHDPEEADEQVAAGLCCQAATGLRGLRQRGTRSRLLCETAFEQV